MFKGTGTALITPFDESFEVDYTALRKFIRFQLDKGINSLVVLGTTGEAATIDDVERRKIIEVTLSEVQKQVPVIVGTGSNNTKKVAEYNKMAEEAGADGLLIVNPYYNKGTQSSLVEHYRYIAERTKLPIILYNVPGRTCMNLLPETALKVHEACPNVIGIKEASGDISQIARLMAMKPENFHVFSGNDDQTIPIMSLGGEGVISVFSNVLPKEMVSLTDAILKGDYAGAREINRKYLKTMNDLFLETNPIPVKYAVSLLGYCRNILRLPLSPASEKTMETLKKEIK